MIGLNEKALLPSKIQKFLDELYLKYNLHSNIVSESTFQFSLFAESINACAIKVVLFSDKRGPVLVVFPAKDGLDFEALKKETNRNLILDSGHQYKNQLRGFSIRNLPPFGRLFQMMMIVDERLQGYESYLIDIGKGNSFIEIDQKGLDVLLRGAVRKRFSKAITPTNEKDQSSTLQKQAQKQTENDERLTSEIVTERFKKGRDLPVMPDVGNQLVALRSEKNIDLVDLVHLIESDAVISAKIIAYASSPFFSYQGRLENVKEAVYHVLGVDLSMNIALALAMGEPFKGPMRGPVGAHSIWRHSVYCAVLSQAIASKIKYQAEIKPGTAYLYGLMHNIGFLVMGHMFSKRFINFNKALEAKQDTPLTSLEKEMLGLSHTRVGSLLLDSWSLPKEYGIIVENHHDSNYSGPYEVYVHIIYLANVLLRNLNIGDAANKSLPLDLLEKYNFTETELNEMLQVIVKWHENLDHLAQQLAA